MDHCIVHIDGGARGNPGPAGVGVVLTDADDGTPLHEAGYYIGRATNNVAEYQGLLRSLKLAAAMQAKRLTVRSDSQLLVRQLNGEYRVKSADLKPLYEKACGLLRRFEHTEIEHVRREQNARADELANLAMDAKRDVVELDGSPFMTAPAEGDDDAPAAPPSSRPASPCWTLTLVDRAASCEAGQRVGQAFRFGATTPAGCCVHAARAALNAAPLDGSPASSSEVKARCARCEGRLLIKIEK